MIYIHDLCTVCKLLTPKIHCNILQQLSQGTQYKCYYTQRNVVLYTFKFLNIQNQFFQII